MPRFNISRRALVVIAIVLSVATLDIATGTHALAARRGWSVRSRPTYRSPGTPTQSPSTSAPGAGTPTPAARPHDLEARGRTDTNGAPHLFTQEDLEVILNEWEAKQAKPNQSRVVHEILEIRRRIQLDPAFRDIANVSAVDVAQAALWDHEGGESAFERALESVNPSEADVAVCHSTSTPQCEATHRWTVRTSPPEEIEHADPSPSAALRSAARVLDARANDCEDAGAYARADELRETARQLRQEARRNGDVTSEK